MLPAGCRRPVWMGQPLSMDLRRRLIAAIDDGMSCRAAATRFGVAPSTAIRWHAQRRDAGHFKPKAQGGDMRSHHVEKRATDILALWEANRDITLEELRAELSKIGLMVSIAGLHRFFKRHGMTWKKDRSCHRAGSPVHPEPAPSLVWRPTRPRSGATRLYRRDLDGDEHDP
jgi:transposase